MACVMRSIDAFPHPAVRGLLKTKEDYNQSVNPSIMRQAMLIFLKQKSVKSSKYCNFTQALLLVEKKTDCQLHFEPS